MTGVIGFKNSKSNMSNRHSIAIILGLGGVVAYFLLIAFCLGESLPDGIADNPTVKGKGKDGECIDYAFALSSRLGSERNSWPTDLLPTADSPYGN
jgi:hypothetical protein